MGKTIAFFGQTKVLHQTGLKSSSGTFVRRPCSIGWARGQSNNVEMDEHHYVEP